jgi:hypothetical protein
MLSPNAIRDFARTAHHDHGNTCDDREPVTPTDMLSAWSNDEIRDSEPGATDDECDLLRMVWATEWCNAHATCVQCPCGQKCEPREMCGQCACGDCPTCDYWIAYR